MKIKNTSRSSVWHPSVGEIRKAYEILQDVVVKTPLTLSRRLSAKYGANIFLKREDLQVVRSYKLRGAYYKISTMKKETLTKGVVCASAGNHAQGVAYACNKLKIHGKIFMPSTTPKQKIKQVEMFGGASVDIVLSGDTFDDAYYEAQEYCKKENITLIHPFNDEQVITGQGTVALEILQQTNSHIDFLFSPLGGGGLISGVSSYFKYLSPDTKIIGVEPEGAPAMKVSIKEDKVVTLKEIDKFVDGAAVKTVGDKNFRICKEFVDDFATVPEGKVCSTLLNLYNEEAIVSEPSGVLSIAVLDDYKEEIKGKNVVCILSGSNNDISRLEEIKERAFLYEGLKNYMIIHLPQRAGALKEFIENNLGERDDIILFEYIKKNNQEIGPALIGIEVQEKEDFSEILKRIRKNSVDAELLNNNSDLLNLLVYKNSGVI